MTDETQAEKKTAKKTARRSRKATADRGVVRGDVAPPAPQRSGPKPRWNVATHGSPPSGRVDQYDVVGG